LFGRVLRVEVDEHTAEVEYIRHGASGEIVLQRYEEFCKCANFAQFSLKGVYTSYE